MPSLLKQNYFMIRTFVLAVMAFSVFAACATHHDNKPYQPATEPEQIEFAHDRLDVYPDDVRKNPDAYTNTPLVWAGIIRSSDAAEEDVGNKIAVNTVFEQHYFDWVQNGRWPHGIKLSLSARGEGLFRTQWKLNRTRIEGNAVAANKYAAPGKLAIVYGVPEKVEPDGTVVLKYRYLRIVDPDHFTTNEFDYGRLGEPFTVLHPKGN